MENDDKSEAIDSEKPRKRLPDNMIGYIGVFLVIIGLVTIIFFFIMNLFSLSVYLFIDAFDLSYDWYWPIICLLWIGCFASPVFIWIGTFLIIRVRKKSKLIYLLLTCFYFLTIVWFFLMLKTLFFSATPSG